MTWWCSADGRPWTWAWQAYPGVWLLVGMVVVVYGVAWRRWLGGPTFREASRFGLGLLLLWGALDWPVGALGAGYLLSVHQAQYVLLTMFAPPLLIVGVPPAWWDRLVTAPGVAPMARRLTKPLPAMLVFNGIVVFTHFPAVVDSLMPSQVGSFVLDGAWLAAGFALWWPVIQPVRGLNPLPFPSRIGFLLLSILIPAAPAAFLIFADYPIYALYELSPPVGRLSAADDQMIGGLVMKLGTSIAVFTATTILWFRWHRAEGELEGEIVLPGVAQSRGP